MSTNTRQLALLPALRVHVAPAGSAECLMVLCHARDVDAQVIDMSVLDFVASV